MNKITGTIIESGSRTIAADGVPIPNVVVKTTWEQLKAWHGAIYGCEVIIESTEIHDAREEWIEQLREQIWRLRDANLQRVAEGMSRWCKPQSPHLAAIAEAIDAFVRRDYKHTLEELAQCGAVIVRMMEAVQALVDEAAKAGKEAKE